MRHNTLRDNLSLVVFTTEEGGKYRGLMVSNEAAELFLSCVRAYGSVPWMWLEDRSRFNPKINVKVYYCAVARLTDPEHQTWDSILDAPRT